MKKLLLFLALLCCGMALWSQPFAGEIAAFQRKDSLQPPPANAILFVGSSSFTKWTDVQDYFPGFTIINRGFGGSSLTDLIRYEDQVIFKYKPKQIVIYCGENDIAASDTVTGRMVFERFRQLFNDIRNALPEVPLVYISMKPSPARWTMKDRMTEGNELIRKFLKKQRHAKFISIWKDMLGPDGKPFEVLFIEDKLHMNEKGYAIWQQAIRPCLKK